MNDRVRTPDAATEHRLEEIRRQAELTGRVMARGIRPKGAPMPQASASAGYYGLPLLKPPVWSWEVPAYFFIGGAAGASAVVGVAAKIGRADPKLVRDARWLAAIGANVGAPLLIADLGRPERFLAMMRVFKPQSPMSVGAWIIAAFGASATAAVILPGGLSDAASVASALAGLGMATYSGVLIGATAIPVWSENVTVLPIHFGASALASAVCILELLGHRAPALHALAIGAAAFETLTGLSIEARDDAFSAPLREGDTGALTRIGGVLSGPVPLLLRMFGGKSKKVRRAAAVSAILGSLITRFAWVEVGKVSAADASIQLGGERR